MKNTLWLYKNSYQIEIKAIEDKNDNTFFERHYFATETEEERTFHTPQVAVYLYQSEEKIISVLLEGEGCTCGIGKENVLLDDDRLLVASGNIVFCILLPSLELLWHTQVDMATCFEIAPYQEDYITHGEVEISRLNRQGEILWQFSGKDILVSPIERTPSFTLTPEGIELVDFNYESYFIDYDGKLLW